MFGRLKDFRRIATRYDRLALNFEAALCLAAAVSYWLSVRSLAGQLPMIWLAVSRRNHFMRTRAPKLYFGLKLFDPPRECSFSFGISGCALS